ncbi:PepSY domain-containing protein [Luteimonas pelagia]
MAWLHLWLGLAAGTVFALVALAGAPLVFHVALLKWQHPSLEGHAPIADGRVLEGIVETWRPRGLRALDLPHADLPVWQGYLADGSRAYFAPDDGRLLLERSHHDDVLLWLHEFHVELRAGPTGREFLGVVGWIALGLLVTGLYLWWPKAGKWLSSLRWHRGPPARRWRSWHQSAGALLSPLLLLLTLTGVGMVYSNGFRTVLVAVFGGGASPAATEAPAAERIEWDAVLARVDIALPGARVSRLSIPAEDDGSVAFRARAPGEWHPVGRSEIRATAAGDRTLQVVDATGHAAGIRIHQAIYPLHVGAVGGGAMRWLTFLGGLLPAFLLVTGALFWWRRRRIGRA